MKQKDKKLIVKAGQRLTNLDIGEVDSFDDIQRDVLYKGKRAEHKSSKSYKDGMALRQGRIVEIRSNYQCQVDSGGTIHTCNISGRLKQFMFRSKMIAAVGDWVEVDASHEPDMRIEHILPHRNALLRYSETSYQKQIIVAANLDNLVITVSWKLPMLKTGLIDRYLCLAALDGISPVICLNKMDLCEDRQQAESAMHYYTQLAIPVVYTSCVTGEGIASLKSLLQDKVTVFSGQSGTGKSSIINGLEPGLNLLTDTVSNYNEKGKHTTTVARMLPWSFGGHLIDTPGLKTVNLSREDKDILGELFPGFAIYHARCYYRSCTHTHETDCAIKDAVQANLIPSERYQSYLRLRESL